MLDDVSGADAIVWPPVDETGDAAGPAPYTGVDVGAQDAPIGDGADPGDAEDEAVDTVGEDIL